jgi:hypothetical protein
MTTTSIVSSVGYDSSGLHEERDKNIFIVLRPAAIFDEKELTYNFLMLGVRYSHHACMSSYSFPDPRKKTGVVTVG